MLKTILMSLALLAPPAIALAGDGAESGGAVWVSEDGKTKVEVKGTVVASAGEEGEPHVVRFVGNGDAGDPQTFVIHAGEGDGRSEVITSHLRKIESIAGRADRGWLGVSISSSTTDGESSGVVVSSVVEGSPAEAAGVEAGDVILAVAGEVVGDETSRAIELISSKKPGDEVEVVVLRAGREVSLDVELGSRANIGVAQRFNIEIPDAEIAEEIRARAHVMLRGDDGEWNFETLGDLEDMDLAFGELDLKALPQLGSRSFRVFSHSDGERTVEVNRDGTTLLITGSDADGITVTRVDENGEESTATYADKGELEANDAEAFEAFQGNRQHGVFAFAPHADGEMKFDIKIDPTDPDSNVFVWRNNMEEGLADAEEAHVIAIQHLEEALEAAREGGAVESLELAERMAAENHARFGKLHFMGGKPKHTFEVQASGAIHVTIRRGENELVQIFADEDDLANRSPNLFDKYADLMDLENE